VQMYQYIRKANKRFANLEAYISKVHLYM